jgi:hypothetical protein
LHDPRSFDLELLQEFVEAFPVVALPLAALIELSPQHPHGTAEELVQADGVSMNAVVYEWLVRPYSPGTFTLQETPSFPWRTNGWPWRPMDGRGQYSLYEKKTA